MTRNPHEQRTTDWSHDVVEERVESFEAARQQNRGARIEDFLPDRSDPEYANVAVELMRVELEHGWREGIAPAVEDYRARFSDVLEVPERLEALAFEDYRCRSQAGQSVLPSDYSRRFSISTQDWPSDTGRPPRADDVDTAVQDLGDESHRLVDAIQLFPDVGDEIAGFRLLEKLGQGTFGAVFRARQSDLAGRDVVLKITAGVSREPQTMARLQHTHIVPVYSIHQIDQVRVLCMPFFGRVTLADVLRRLSQESHLPTTGAFFADCLPAVSSSSDPLSTRDGIGGGQPVALQELSQRSYVDACLSIGERLAGALAHAHQRGILHRDVKPANVLLTDDGQPMLLDFNISDDLGGRASSLVGGTLPYMSPEQQQSMVTGQRVDVRSDIYSLGVVLYQLLTGRLPWDGKSSARRTVTAKELRERNPRLPRSVAELVARCLHPDPARRYDSMEQVRDDLQRHLANQPLQHTPDRSLTERMRKWARRHPAWLSGSSISAFAAVLLLGVVGLLLMVGGQMRRSEAFRQLEFLQQQLPEMRMMVSSQLSDPAIREDVTGRLHALVASYGVTGSEDWQQNWLVRWLPEERQAELRQNMAEVLYLLAAVEWPFVDGDAARDPAAVASALRWNQLAQQAFALEDVPRGLLSQQDELQSLLAASDAVPVRPPRELPPPKTSMERFLLAQQDLRQRRFDAAAENLEALCLQDALDYSSRFLLGNAYVGQGRLSEAEDCFTTCLVLWPPAYLAHFNRGLCRLQMQRYAEAEIDFTKVIDSRDDLAAAWFNRALCRKAERRYGEAIEDLSQALKFGDPNSRFYLVRSRVYEAMGDAKAAAADRQRGLATTPREDDVAGWIARGLARVDTNPELALDDLLKAQEYARNSREVLRNLAYVRAERLGQTEQAIADLNRLIELYSHDEDLMSRAVLKARKGIRDAAVQDGLQALQRAPNDKLLYQMGCVYALNCQQDPGDVVLATSYLARAIVKNPKWIAAAVKDPDLTSLRDQAPFQRLLRSAVALQQIAAEPRTGSQDSSAARPSARDGDPSANSELE